MTTLQGYFFDGKPVPRATNGSNTMFPYVLGRRAGCSGKALLSPESLFEPQDLRLTLLEGDLVNAATMTQTVTQLGELAEPGRE